MPGGTQRQSPDDDTTTFVGYLLSKSLSALNINPHKLNDDKSLFSFLRQMPGNTARPVFSAAIDRYLLAAGPTAANPTQRRAAADGTNGQTDRQTDGLSPTVA